MSIIYIPIEEKAIEEAAKTARHYLDAILLSPLSELGLLATDNISFWRFKGQVKTVLKTRAFLEENGFDSSKFEQGILPENVVPLIEASAETNDETLSDLFAGLLASVISLETNTHPSFSKVLNQMSGLDAKVLVLLINCLESYKPTPQLHRKLTLNIEKGSSALGAGEDVLNLTFENLRRLGVCDHGNDVLNAMNQVKVVALTDFGLSLMKTCMKYLPAEK